MSSTNDFEEARRRASARLEARARVLAQPRAVRAALVLPRYLKCRLLLGTRGMRPVNVETFWGGAFEGILPERVSTVIARYHFFDPHVSRGMMNYLRPGDVMLDVGAHFGFFTLLGSWLVGRTGRVISIEAMASTFGQLRRNVEHNAAWPNVATFQIAAGDQEGSLTFHDFGLELSSLNSAFGARGPMAEVAQSRATAVDVSMTRLDTLLAHESIDHLDFVKIDAESSEHLVLAGLSESLENFDPIIVVEVSDVTPTEKEHTGRIVSMLRRKGYDTFRMDGNDLLEVVDGVPIGYDSFFFAKPGNSRIRRTLTP